MGKAQPIKEQAFAVVRTSCFSCAGQQRYKWLADLDNQVQQAVELIKGNRPLPVVIKVKSERSTEIVFECGQKSWVEAYEVPFSSKRVPGQATDRDCYQALFLQLVGDIPIHPGFCVLSAGNISTCKSFARSTTIRAGLANSLYEHMQAGLAPKSVNGNLLLLHEGQRRNV